MVGGDIVRQNRQRTHTFQTTFGSHIAFPVGRPANIGALRPPLVKRADLNARALVEVKHRDIGLTELLRLHSSLHNRIDFAIVGPDIF